MPIYKSKYNLKSSEIISLSRDLNHVIYRMGSEEDKTIGKTIYLYDIDELKRITPENQELLDKFNLKPKSLEEKATKVNLEEIE